ncbi:S-layer homology domain-containing protein [Caminicella sporogenes DSM 14501]|uniref:S-layer homology domain-containing protein n=1 Tax=Caminicella sporogenes DSM 14501 TaxID=1121266 RepID=A0A1M6PRC0_9FIRM|nr:S-layer homology domain-containing protein [Caminicella sporogenes]RKD22008.1 hypothetical protein BET04_07090 [Caminicella sporogenes]SHK10442.1 S-layer homology domain-containing protein [Caminicella sporogenes DSM 14501]
MKKRLIALLTVLMIFSSTVCGFAAVKFSDVSSNHWARTFIEKMADKGIIKGYYDSVKGVKVFKPESPVTYIEAVQMIYNTLKASDKLKSESGLDTKYDVILKNLNIPTWSKRAVSYALEYDIITFNELRSFMNGKIAKYARKVDIAVFLGRAIGVDGNSSNIYTLPFIDSEMIIGKAIPYVDFLTKKGIIKGDSSNKFNPNSIVNRAVMATMCSKVYDYLISHEEVLNKEDEIKDSNGDTLINDNKNNESNESDNKIYGVIDYIAEDTDMIVIKDLEGNTKVYNLKGVSIRKKGRKVRIDDLKKEEEVELVFDKGKLKEVNVTNSKVYFEAKIEKIVDFDDYYLLKTRNADNLLIKKDFKVDDETVIYYGDDKVSIGRIEEGDYAVIKHIGDKALEIQLKSEEQVYDGILESDVIFKDKPELKIRLNNNKVLEFEIDDKAYIRRDRRKADLDDLSKGDIATITVQYNKIVEIIASSRSEKDKDEGRIKQIVIGTPSKITIVTDDDEEATYEVARDVDVEIDDEDAELNDLDINYYVKLDIENGRIVEIRAEKSKSDTNITGRIVKIYKDYDRLTVKYYDKVEDRYKRVSVIVSDKTKIISSDGDSIRLGHLKRDVQIFVSGYFDEDIFVADKIIELE